MKLVIDRIEENLAVCENLETREMIQIEIQKLPSGIKEGTVIKFEGNEYLIDKDEENQRRKRIEEKMNRLWS